MSRSYRGCRTILDRSTRYREAIRITIGKSWRSSIDNKVSRRYWGGVEPAFKISFSRCEKHRHECNPTSNSTNDPLNILSSQNHLSIIILSTWISKKKHTHTLNKSNQFYISKTNHDSLVSMAKSHCTCTCIKNIKEYCVLCVKNIARLHKCLHVMTIWDMRKSL